jgi:CBS domain-containing protein
VNRMIVKDAMTKKVITIDRNATVLDACNKYRDCKVGCLVVTDKSECVGIVTERDLIERTICARRNPEETKVGDIMSLEIKTVHALDTLEKAVQIMKHKNIKKLPVLLNEEIVGIITVTDIARAQQDSPKKTARSWIETEWSV